MPVARHPGRGAFWLARHHRSARVRRRRVRQSDDNTSSSSTSTAAASAATSTPAAAAPADAPDPQPAVAPRSGGSGTPIKIAIMSECKGAFGSFDNQNMAGAVAALVAVRRGQAEEPQQAEGRLHRRRDRRPPAQARRRGLRRRHVGHGDQGGPPAHGAARRRRHDRPALRRRVDRGRQLRQAAPGQDVRRRLRGRAGHDAQGAGAELLPLQRRRRAVERRPGRHRLQQAGLEEGRGRRRRLQLRLDVGGRLHRGVLRRGRPGHQAGLPAAEHDRLLVATRSRCRPTWTAPSSPSAARA